MTASATIGREDGGWRDRMFRFVLELGQITSHLVLITRPPVTYRSFHRFISPIEPEGPGRSLIRARGVEGTSGRDSGRR